MAQRTVYEMGVEIPRWDRQTDGKTPDRCITLITTMEAPRVMECSYHSSDLTSPDRISTDLISSELSALLLVAATANWVASQRTNQFSVAATNQSALSSDETRSVETRSNGVSLDE